MTIGYVEQSSEFMRAILFPSLAVSYFCNIFCLGAVDLIQIALRTHQKTKELRDIVGPILTLLIPLGELEEMARRNIGAIREGLDVSNGNTV